jgi:predicted HTH domain antitoxin
MCPTLNSQDTLNTAIKLFTEGKVSLVRGAHMAGVPLSDFVSHVSRSGIAVVNLSAEGVHVDMEVGSKWFAQR